MIVIGVLASLVLPVVATRGGLKATRELLSPAEILPPVDPLECPVEPILHDPRDRSDPVINEYFVHRQEWLEQEFHPKRSAGTFRSHDDLMYIKLPNGGSFVYWQQREGADGWAHPVFDISAWHTDEFGHMEPVEGAHYADPYTWNFVHPNSQYQSVEIRDTIKIQGDYVVFVSGWFAAYQHIIIDRLGYFLYMVKTLPETTRILMPSYGDSEFFRRMIFTVEPQLIKRIDTFECKEYPRCDSPRIQVENGSLSILAPKSSTAHLDLFELIRSWLWNSPRIKENVIRTETEKTIVYYTRNPEEGKTKASNSRFMDAQQEEQIIGRIEHAIQRYGRTEKLVVFNGDLSFLDQIKLFHSASILIGPHGGGLANILLMAPAKRGTCETRPKVLEFVTSMDTPSVQGGISVGATYHTLFLTCPWVELHQVLFTPESTPQVTYINMDAFDDALKSLFSRSTVQQLGAPTRY